MTFIGLLNQWLLEILGRTQLPDSAAKEEKGNVDGTSTLIVSCKYLFGLNNILFIIRYTHAYIQTIQLTIGSDGKHSAYMKVIY